MNSAPVRPRSPWPGENGSHPAVSRKSPRVIRSPRLPAVAAALVLSAVAGCSGTNAVDQSTANVKGYVAGNGSVHVVPAADRHAVGPLHGTDLTGRPIDVAQWRGDVVVVNVWASWCAPCRSEAKSLQAVYDETRSLGVRFLGVDVKDDAANAGAFVRRHGLTYPSLEDEPGRVGLAFRPPPGAIPSTVVLDRQHREAARFSGEVRYTQLLAVVRDVAGEQPS